jgi:hypothetical protein
MASWLLCVPTGLTTEIVHSAHAVCLCVLYGSQNSHCFTIQRYLIELQARSQNCERRLLDTSRPSVRPCAWNSLVSTGWIFMKFDVFGVHRSVHRIMFL